MSRAQCREAMVLGKAHTLSLTFHALSQIAAIDAMTLATAAVRGL